MFNTPQGVANTAAVVTTFNGDGAGVGNTGVNVVGLGTTAAYNNTGSDVVAIGSHSASYNSGAEVSAIGLDTATSNSGTSVVALGTTAASVNSGNYVSAVGEASATSNTANEVVALGHYAGSQTEVGGLVGRAWKAVTTGETTGSNIYGPDWGQIVSSADGTVLLAGEYGNLSCNGDWYGTGLLYISRDSGNTWKVVKNVGVAALGNYSGIAQGYGTWPSVAMDVCGTVMFAVDRDYDNLWNSTDGGITWNANLYPDGYTSNWRAVACSSNAQVVALVEKGGSNNLWVSSDGGQNWQLQVLQGDFSGSSWQCVAVSADGNYMLAGDISNSNVWVGSNNGLGIWVWNAWSAVNPSNAGEPAFGFWRAFALSSNGQYMYAAESSNEYLWRSQDYGSNWLPIGSNSEFRAVACTPNGKTVMYGADVCSDQPSYAISSNYGTTFATLSAAFHIGLLSPRTIAMDATGTKLAIGGGPACGPTGNALFMNLLASNIVAIGLNAGLDNTGSDTVHIGTNAGASNTGFNVIAIGSNAGVSNALPTGAGYESLLTDSLFPSQSNAIAIGTAAGSNNFAANSIAIGCNAGTNTTGGNTIAIGTGAGVSLSGASMTSTVLIGEGAGSGTSGAYGLVAIGSNAGRGDRSFAGNTDYTYGNLTWLQNTTVSIGSRAGEDNTVASINIGYAAGTTNSTYNAISIGSNAGGGNQVDWQHSDSGASYGAAVSSNGEYMYSVSSYAGVILSNGNHGNSYGWHNTLSEYSWTDIACTGDGQYVIACENDGGGYLWFTSNYARNYWHNDGGFNYDTSSNVFYGFWRTVTVAANNSNIIFAGECNSGTGGLWMSTDAGATMCQIPDVGTGDWRSVRCDASGGYVVAVDSYNYQAWVRDPSGTWTNVTNLPQLSNSDVPDDYFWACAISSNGQYMYVAGSDYGCIWASSNYGSNWINLTDREYVPYGYWRGLACSGDGQVVSAATFDSWNGGDHGRIWRSTDAGLTWYKSGPRGVRAGWRGLGCDSDTGRYVLGAAAYSYQGVWASVVPDMDHTVSIGTKTGSNSIGSCNVFMGSNAGHSNLASDTVFVGANAGRWNSGDYSVGIGHAALCAGSASNCIAIGHAALGSNGACLSNGDYVPYNYAANSIAIGDHAGEGNGTQGDAPDLIAIGTYAGYSNVGHRNIAIGSNAGAGSNFNDDRIAIGTQAGSNSAGFWNIFIGSNAGIGDNGNENIAIGVGASASNTSANILLGSVKNSAVLPSTGGKFIVTTADGLRRYLSGDRYGCTFGIGTHPDPAYNLDVSGNGYFSGDLGVGGTITGTVVAPPSDRTLKQEIVATTLGLDFVKSLKPVDYKFINKPEVLRHGFIAQDVQEVAPELVRANPNTEKLGLEITDIIAPLVKAVQELSAEVADLKAQLARLQA